MAHTDARGYGNAHQRLHKARGPARQYTCPCGKPAEEWAYGHNDPEPLMSREEVAALLGISPESVRSTLRRHGITEMRGYPRELEERPVRAVADAEHDGNLSAAIRALLVEALVARAGRALQATDLPTAAAETAVSGTRRVADHLAWHARVCAEAETSERGP